ncbi:MAG TPA: hypothetical protein VD837_17660 [Terriglobales bacterium]|nr:hypothetical protein [Terriglobales bacterium]
MATVGRGEKKATGSERVQFRATLDLKSEEYLDGLARVLQLKRGPLVAKLVKTLHENKRLTSQFITFYRNVWPTIEPRKIQTARLFNWPVEVDDALKYLSFNAIPTGNKSEMVRVLIAFFASQYKIPEFPDVL